MAKSALDGLGWIVNLIMTIILDPIWNGVNRILRGRIFWGIIWIITGGLFVVGWIIDIFTVIFSKEITVLA